MPSSSSTPASEPSQKVWPTTEACWRTRRSWAESESSRAASTAWTVSGSVWTSCDPSSRIRLTISSANRGLPAERSATCGDEVGLAVRPLPLPPGAARRPARASRPASAARARSWSRCAGRRPSPGGGRAARRAPGRRSGRARGPSAPGTRSGRACPRRPSGCPRSRSPRASGDCAASTSERTAENRRSRICCGSSASWTPVDRRVLGRGLDAERAGDASAAIRSGGSSVSSVGDRRLDPVQELAQASSESSVSTISNWPRMISPSAQYASPAP